jgi:molybdenum cofactor cytidylyltransferase
MTDIFAAVVLAAGESRRMGEPKQLLPWHGTTFIAQIVGTLAQAPLDDIVVVLGHRADEVRSALDRAGLSAPGRSPSLKTVYNEHYREGMLSSLQCGIAALDPQTRAAFIVLSDQPQMKAATLARLRAEMERTGSGMVVPSHAMRRGHPLLIDLQRYRAEIMAIDGPPGLQKVLRAHPDDILHVVFDDPDVLADLDTPEDYRRALHAP